MFPYLLLVIVIRCASVLPGGGGAPWGGFYQKYILVLVPWLPPGPNTPPFPFGGPLPILYLVGGPLPFLLVMCIFIAPLPL